MAISISTVKSDRAADNALAKGTRKDYLLSMPYEQLPDLSNLSLAEIAELNDARKLPPVERWNPEKTSGSHMRIAADGSWFHNGSKIARPAMIRAFLSILRKESDGSYWLVTPHYKQSIEVEDVPFLAVEMEVRGSGVKQQLAFRLNSDEITLAGPDRPLRFETLDDAPRPYVMARGEMEARLTRNVFYRLVDIAIEHPDDGTPGLWSGGTFFPLRNDGSRR